MGLNWRFYAIGVVFHAQGDCWHVWCISTWHNQLGGGMMINDSKVYYDAGYKAGQAMKRQDIGLYNHMRDWYRKAQRLENDTDKTIAGTNWDQGYSDGRGTVRVEYFR